MNTPMEWARWAAKQRKPWRLSDGQAAVLQQLANHANRDGETHVGVKTIAELSGRRERTVRKILRELQTKGLVSSERRGNGQTARRVLNDVVPVEQLGLDLSQTGRPADRQTGRPATADVPQIGTPEDTQKSQEGLEEEEDTRETQPVELVAPRLGEVMRILETAPGLQLDEMAVNSALCAYRESAGHDHIAAAHTVASYAHQKILNTSIANLPLLAELRKQSTRRDGPARPRPARPAPAPVEKPWWDGALARAMRREQQTDTEGIAS